MRDQPTPSAPPPNRAARRGKQPNPDPTPARHHGPPVSARPAQGRRVNPVRRTG